MENKNKDFKRDLLTFVDAFGYYSSNKIAASDLLDTISPRVYFERGINHILSMKKISPMYLEFIVSNLRKSIVKNDYLKDAISVFRTVIEKSIFLEGIDWNIKGNKSKYVNRATYTTKAIKPYAVKLKALKKKSFEQFDSKAFKKINRLLSSIEYGVSNDALLIDYPKALVAYLLELGYTNKQLNKKAEATRKRVASLERFAECKLAVSKLVFHFSSAKRVENIFNVAFPINSGVGKSILVNEVEKYFYERDVELEFLTYEEVEESISTSSRRRMIGIDKKAFYMVFKNYRSFDEYNVMQKSVNSHLKWISGHFKVVFNKELVREDALAIIYDSENKSFWHSEQLNSPRNIVLFPNRKENLNKYVELNSIINNTEVLKFIQASFSLLSRKESKLEPSTILNLNKIIDALPGYNGYGKYDSPIFWLSNITKTGYVKAALFNYYNVFRKDIESAFGKKIKKEIGFEEFGTIFDGNNFKKVENELFKFLVTKAFNTIKNSHKIDKLISFVVIEAKQIRNEFAHEHSGKTGDYKTIIISYLESLISITLFEMVTIAYDNSETIESTKNLKLFMDIIMKYDSKSITKFNKTKKLSDLLV